MEEPGFWDDADAANAQMKELKNLKDTIPKRKLSKKKEM